MAKIDVLVRITMEIPDAVNADLVVGNEAAFQNLEGDLQNSLPDTIVEVLDVNETPVHIMRPQ